MGEEQKHPHQLAVDKEEQKKGKRSFPVPPVCGTAESPPNPPRNGVHHASGGGGGGVPRPTPPRQVLPRSRLAPPVPSQRPPATTRPEMIPGGAANTGAGGSAGQLCQMACGGAASLGLVVVGILLCLAPLYLHGGDTLVMLLGCLGLFLVVLGLIGLFLSFLGLGTSSNSSCPDVVIPTSAVKQPLLGGRRGSGRPGRTMTVVVE